MREWSWHHGVNRSGEWQFTWFNEVSVGLLACCWDRILLRSIFGTHGVTKCLPDCGMWLWGSLNSSGEVPRGVEPLVKRGVEPLAKRGVDLSLVNVGDKQDPNTCMFPGHRGRWEVLVLSGECTWLWLNSFHASWLNTRVVDDSFGVLQLSRGSVEVKSEWLGPRLIAGKWKDEQSGVVLPPATILHECRWMWLEIDSRPTKEQADSPSWGVPHSVKLEDCSLLPDCTAGGKIGLGGSGKRFCRTGNLHFKTVRTVHDRWLPGALKPQVTKVCWSLCPLCSSRSERRTRSSMEEKRKSKQFPTNADSRTPWRNCATSCSSSFLPVCSL